MLKIVDEGAEDDKQNEQQPDKETVDGIYFHDLIVPPPIETISGGK